MVVGDTGRVVSSFFSNTNIDKMFIYKVEIFMLHTLVQ